jgi:hypothetical protein
MDAELDRIIDDHTGYRNNAAYWRWEFWFMVFLRNKSHHLARYNARASSSPRKENEPGLTQCHQKEKKEGRENIFIPLHLTENHFTSLQKRKSQLILTEVKYL